MKKLVAIKGVFWNIRGLNKSGRLQIIADLISLNKFDFLGLQETKKEVINDNFLKAMIKDFC
jgi:exonuclease III